MALIIRLHPAFLLDMKRNRFWSKDDFNKLRLFCEESDNIVWDDSTSYNRAYRVADGILTDGFCGIILSSLPLMVPVCTCYRYDLEVKPGHTEFVRSLYQAHSVGDLNNYLNLIRLGKDPMF